MKTIGLIGGMSWESTVSYYSIINETIKEKLGGLHSAKLLMYSVDFDELEKCLTRGDWEQIVKILSDAAQRLELAGADLILICTNTMHRVYPQVQAALHVPLIHIAEATADALEKEKFHTVALLGTWYTMTQDFYKDRLKARGLRVLIPQEEDIRIVDDVIFRELCLGIINEHSRQEYARIISALKDAGAEAVILGCTEIGLLIRPEDSSLPTFDTTLIHAKAAAHLALS